MWLIWALVLWTVVSFVVSPMLGRWMKLSRHRLHRTVRPVSEDEADEVRQFMVKHVPELGIDLQHMNPYEYPVVYRLAVDDMRRMQAGEPVRHI